jgi:hypothetical protein
MAVVVEQTIPFSSSSLDLQNPRRWNELYPLMRPGTKQHEAAKGHPILIRSSLISSKFCMIAAVITSSGNFSSKLLDGCKVAAIVTEGDGDDILTALDIKQALRNAGATEHQGLVIVRVGKSRKLQHHQSDEILEVEVDGQLEYDHFLHFVANLSKGSRRAIEFNLGPIQSFMNCSITAYSTFGTEKAEGKPTISLGAEGSSGSFESVKSTVKKELESLFKSHKTHKGENTYCIHYADVNGLSRLENYIIAKEIAEYCCKYPKSIQPPNLTTNHQQQHQTPKTSPSPSPTQQSSTPPPPAAASASPSFKSLRTRSLLRKNLKQKQQPPPRTTALPFPKLSPHPTPKLNSTTPQSAHASTPVVTPSSKKNPQSQNTTPSSATATAGTRCATAQNKSSLSSKTKTSLACRRQ